MTLEQIKQRQIELNNQLEKIAVANYNLINYIVGTRIIVATDNSETLNEEDGLINDIERIQDHTQVLIGDLEVEIERLSTATFYTSTDSIGKFNVS